MKKLLFVIFLLVVSLSCVSKKTENTDKQTNESVEKSKVTVKFSYNLETVALIFNLSEAGKLQFEQNPEPRAILARELTNKFQNFKNHEAVQKVNNLVDEGFVDLYDIGLSLYSTNLPDFDQYADFPPIYYENDSLSHKEVRKVFNDFNQSVKKFYQDANLKDFFENEAKPLYSKLMAEINTVTPNDNYVQVMEDYYGIKRNSYTIIVSAFSFNGIGRSNTMRTPEGINIVQFVASNPDDESDTIDLNNLDSFTIGYTNKAYFQEIAIHELGHSFFHETLRENKDIISKVDELEYLFTDSLKKDMRNQGYTNWRTCFEEHLVRLGEIKIAQLLGDTDFADTYMNYCIEKRGFVYMKTMQNVLKEYEDNRNLYNSIQEFIPVLIEKIKSHKE